MILNQYVQQLRQEEFDNNVLRQHVMMAARDRELPYVYRYELSKYATKVGLDDSIVWMEVEA